MSGGGQINRVEGRWRVLLPVRGGTLYITATDAAEVQHTLVKPAPPAPADSTAPAREPLPVPRAITAGELRLMAARLEACTPPDGPPCPNFKGAGVLTVHCEGCSCTGLSLRTGACRLGKWPITLETHS